MAASHSNGNHHSNSNQKSKPQRTNRFAGSGGGKFVSAPFSTDTPSLPDHSAAFPKRFSHSGYLDIRSRADKPWKRRYFVVSNNFLLWAATPHAQKLERVCPLEGSQIRTKKRKKHKNNDHTPMQSDCDPLTFELFIRKHQLFFRAASPQQCETWKDHITKASKLKIKDIYRFLYTLGTSESQMTKVVAAKHKTTEENCAIKIVDKRNCESKMLKTEIQILKKLDSPYIVKLHDIFETKKFLYIVMEMCLGGELFDQIAELDGDHYTEADCCLILHQIARGVQYMHDQGIVHRDLKPENILCVHPNSIKQVKLADFGISKMVKNKPTQKKNGHLTAAETHHNQQMKTIVGTLSYTAPEILRGKGYDHTVDYWSIGVIMFILLCGYPPFYGEDENEISRSILKEEVEFDPEDWDHVSQETQELVAGLLNKTPQKRYTTFNLLNLTFKVSSKNVSFNKARSNFKRTLALRKFKRHSMAAIERNSHAHDDMNGGFGVNAPSKNTHALHPKLTTKRKSKTTEDLSQLNLPFNMRASVNEDFQTDDDVRKQKQKKKRKHEDEEEEDEDDDDEKSNENDDIADFAEDQEDD